MTAEAASERSIRLRPPWGGPTLTITGGISEASLFAEVERHGGRYGGGVMRILPDLLPPDGVMVDAGAHIGLLAVPAASLVPHGRVHAIEPVARSADLLQRNAESNPGQVSVHRFALWDSECEGKIAAEQRFSAGAALTAGTAGTAVPLRTLDAWADEIGLERLDLLKLDVEGAEVAALRAARRTLERHRPAIIVECNPPALARAGAGGLDALMAEVTRTAPHVRWLGWGGARPRIRGAGDVLARLRRHGVGDLVATARPLRRALAPRALVGRIVESAAPLRPRAPRFVLGDEIALRALSDAPARMRPRSVGTVAVEVRNAGPSRLSSRWRRHPVHIASRWWGPAGEPVTEGERAALTDALRPGDRATVELRIVAPEAPGPYELAVTGVQEHYAWLDAHGPCAVLRWPVIVAGD